MPSARPWLRTLAALAAPWGAALVVVAAPGCRTAWEQETRGWPRYETRIAGRLVAYALPPEGETLVAPETLASLDLAPREKVRLFASLGYGASGVGPGSAARVSLGIGRIPGPPLAALPDADELGRRLLREAGDAGHRGVHYTHDVVSLGGTRWFRLENHVPSAGGVQPEAVVYYRALTPGHHLFVWGLWQEPARRTPGAAAALRAQLARVAEGCRVSPAP